VESGEKEREGGRRRREGEGATRDTLRVDRIGAPNLGIRICRLICGFHRNCLSTRCLHARGRHIHLLYVSPHETRASSRVRARHPTSGCSSSVGASYTRWPSVPFFQSLQSGSLPVAPFFPRCGN